MICEFIDYIPVENEKYLGVAVVKLYDKIQVMYKWMERKDGKGCFANPATFKIGETYEPAILIDSRIDDKQIMDAIRNGVNAKLNGGKIQMQQSIFPTKPSFEPKDNDCPF